MYFQIEPRMRSFLLAIFSLASFVNGQSPSDCSSGTVWNGMECIPEEQCTGYMNNGQCVSSCPSGTTHMVMNV
jgi:hypothetical protein